MADLETEGFTYKGALPQFAGSPDSGGSSFIGDVGRATGAGFVDATASVLGFGEYLGADGLEDTRKSLQAYAEATRANMDPNRRRMLEAEIFAEPGSDKASFGADPFKSALLKIAGATGSTIPSVAGRIIGGVVGGVTGGPVGAAIGIGTEFTQTIGGVFTDIKDKALTTPVDKMPPEMRRIYDIAREEGFDDAGARRWVVRDLSQYALFAGGAATILGLGGAGLGGAGSAATQITGRVLQRGVAGARREAGEEAGQALGEIGGRIPAGVGPTSWQAGVNQVLEGALAGGALGAAASMAGGRHKVEVIPGRAPDAAQTQALQTHSPPPPPVSQPVIPPTANDDMPGYTGVPPVGDPMPTGQPPRQLSPFDVPGYPQPYDTPAPQNVPAPGAQPGTELDQSNPSAVFASLPPQTQHRLQQLFSDLRTKRDVVTRQQIADEISGLLQQVGVPSAWLQARPSPTGAPFATQMAGLPLERTLTREMFPAAAAPGPAPEATPLGLQPVVPQAPTPVGPGGGGGPAVKVRAIPVDPIFDEDDWVRSQGDRTPTVARTSMRTGTMATPADAKAALKESFIGTGQNELAGTRTRLTPAQVDALVEDIFDTAQAEAAKTGSPLDVAALVDATQLQTQREYPGVREFGDLVVGEDRAGRPVRMRDVLLGMATQLQGSAIKNPIPASEPKIGTQNIDPFGSVTKSGRAEQPTPHPASPVEVRKVAGLAKEREPGIMRAARAFAEADDPARTTFLDKLREFIGALQRATVRPEELVEGAKVPPSTGARGNALRRLGEAQTRLDALRDVVWGDTTPGRIRGVGSALIYAYSTIRQMAPEAHAKLKKALLNKGVPLYTLAKTFDEIQSDAAREIQGRVDEKVEPKVLPTGKAHGGKAAKGFGYTKDERRFQPTEAEVRTLAGVRERYPILSKPSEQPQPPSPAPKNLPAEPASAAVDKAETEARQRKVEKQRAAKVKKVKGLAAETAVAEESESLSEDQLASVLVDLPQAVLGNAASAAIILEKLKNFGIRDPQAGLDVLMELANAQQSDQAAGGETAGEQVAPVSPPQATSQPGVQGAANAPAGRGTRRGGVRPAAGAAGGGPRSGAPAAQPGQGRQGSTDSAAQPVEAAGRVEGKPALVRLDEKLLPKVEHATQGWDALGTDGLPILDDVGEEGVSRGLAAFKAGMPEFGLFDGTGVGKTRQEIALAVEGQRTTKLPSLIITKSEAVIGDMVRAMNTMKIPPDERPEIRTYDNLARDKISTRQRGFVIFDESHNLKNTQTSKAQTAQLIPAQFVVRATATPFDTFAGAAATISSLEHMPITEVTKRLGFELAEKASGELIPQLNKGMTWDQVPREIAKWRDKLVAGGQLVRRVLPFWGEPAQHDIALGAEFRASEAAIDMYWSPLISQNPSLASQRVQELRYNSELAKIPDVKRQITAAIKAGKSVVVVAERSKKDVVFKSGLPTQTSTLEQLSAWATQQGIDHARVFGGGSTPKVHADQFRDNKVKLALMTPKTGGTGIELDDQTGGHSRLMIVMTLDYAGDTFEQVLGRVSRRQTKTPAEVRLLNIPGSQADAHSQKVNSSKMAVLHAGQQGQDTMQSSLEEDIRRHQEAKDRHLRLRDSDPEPHASPAVNEDREDKYLQGSEVEANRLAQGLLAPAVAGNNNTTLKAVMPQIAEKFADPVMRILAQKVTALMPDTLVVSMENFNKLGRPMVAAGVAQMHSYNRLGGNFRTPAARAGSYRTSIVGINPDRARAAETLLHEAVHAATQAALWRDRAVKGTTSAALDRVVAQLRGLGWDNHDNPRLKNAAKDADELLAEAFASVQVQEELKRVQLDKPTYSTLVGNAWDAIVNAVRVLLGVRAVNRDALSAVLQAGTRLMEQDAEFRRTAGDATHEEVALKLTMQSLRGPVAVNAVTNMMATSGNPAPNTAIASAGILDDTAAHPNGIAARLLSTTRSVGSGLWRGALASSSLDWIKEWNKSLIDLTQYQKMKDNRTARVSQLVDDEKLTHLGGEHITGKAFFDKWTDLKNADPVNARIFDRLLTQSTEQQVHLDRDRAGQLPKKLGGEARRARMYDKLRPVYDAMVKSNPAWGDLYPAVREYYQEANRIQRDAVLTRLKGDIQEANPGIDLSTIKFEDLKAVKAAVNAGTLSDKHHTRIKDIHAIFATQEFYVPLRRRGDYVVRANIMIDGTFDPAVADDILESIADRRLMAVTQPDGKVALRIRPSDAPDPTDPTVRAGGPAGQGNPLPIYERYENRADAEARINWLQKTAARYANQTGAGKVELDVKNLQRQKQDPAQIQHADPTISRQAQRELSDRIDRIVEDSKDRVKMKRLVAEVTAGLLPDTYVSKGRIRRRFIAGASQDQLRALGEYITAFSHNVAHVEHDREIEDHLREVETGVLKDTRYDKGGDREKAQLVMREVRFREDAQLDRAKPAGWVNAATGVTYFYMLTSASYSMIQMTQPTMVGLPLLGAKYGVGRSLAAMARASAMFRGGTLAQGVLRTFGAGGVGANMFDYEPVLLKALENQPDGKRLMEGLKYARDIGAADLSFSREITETRTLPSSHRGERSVGQHIERAGQLAMDYSRMLPHAVEVGNRALMFVAAYRLEHARGQDHDAAVEAGIDAIRKSQIDYSTGNKARVLQSKWGGGIARIPLMFKQYALHMYTLFAINAAQAIGGATTAERREGLKAVAGLLSTHAMAAGAAGIMLEPIKIAIYAAAQVLGLLDPDEEKFDVDKWMHKGLRNIFGDTLGEAAFGGLPRLLGVDVSQRMGLQSLLLFNTLDDLDKGKSGYEIVGSVILGPAGSLVVKNIPDAFANFAKGDTLKGLEGLTPKFIRDGVKATRLGTEGLLDKHGNRIDKTLDIDAGVLAAQVLGFRPNQLANLYEARDAIIDKKEFIQNRVSGLMEQYWRTKNDAAGRAEVMEDIQAFNRANPRERITGDRLRQSMRTRRDQERQAIDGVYLSRRQRYIAEEAAYLR